MTFREPENPMYKKVGIREATLGRSKFRSCYHVQFWTEVGGGCLGSGGSDFAEFPLTKDGLADALTVCELYCRLASLPDPDTRPMFINTPTFGKDALVAMGMAV